MIGIVCEKPSAARNFAKALGGKTGTYNGEPYLIVNARGHLFEYAPPEEQVAADLKSKYKVWKLDNLPWNEREVQFKRQRISGTAPIAADIKKGLAKCDEICIASDVDPTGEGDLLVCEILVEENIRIPKLTRMYFMDEGVKSIQDAFVNRKTIPSIDKNMDYVKALYRSKWDWLSMQWTRILTICGDGQSVLRTGRLKGGMIILVGDALKALKAYKKIPYYQNRFRDENGVVYSNPDEPVFPDKAQVPNSYTDSAVIVDSKTMKKSAPPKLIDLATLASMLAPKGYKAKQVQDVYQKMYEAQVVSYPRTEDKVITPEQFNELLPLVDKIAGLVGVDTSLLTHRTPRKTHVKTGGAHGANRPGPNVPSSLDDLATYGACAKEIYTILARNYLAMLGEDYEYESQKGHLEKYPDFKGSANVPKKLGYKAIFGDMDEPDEDDNSNGLGTNASPFVHEGFPPKPPTPTMKWLMKELEKNDIGTGATRTSTYADITNDKAKYPLLVDTRGKITMTQFGEMQYMLLPGTHIGTLEITKTVRGQMEDIANGKLDSDRALMELQKLIEDDIPIIKANSDKMRAELGITMKSAGGTGAAPKEKYTGMWTGKPVTFTRVWNGHRFTDDECVKLCNGEELIVAGLVSKTGKSYAVKGKLEKQTYSGHDFVGFKASGYVNVNPDGTVQQGIPNEWCKHVFTAAEKDALLKGDKISIKDAWSEKKKKPFACMLSYVDKGNGQMGFKTEFASGEQGVPDEWCGHRFTDDEKTMLAAGLSIRADDFVSKKSHKEFSCSVHWGKNDRGYLGIIAEFEK